MGLKILLDSLLINMLQIVMSWLGVLVWDVIVLREWKSGTKNEEIIYLFIAMIKGIHDEYGMLKVNCLVYLSIMMANKGTKIMKLMRVWIIY